MRAGRMRHLIDIERSAGADDSYGEAAEDWQPLLKNYPARVRDDSQREFTAQMQVQGEKTVHVEIRDPRIELKQKDRVTFTHPVNGATVYDIKAILSGENIGRDLLLICTEHSTE